MTTVRRATRDDATAIAGIYAQGIAAGTATVVSRAPSPEQLAERMASARPEHTWLVAERDDEVVGWAATMPYLLVPEYGGVAEFSVYVAEGQQGRGVGRVLMATLLAAAEQAGLHKLTSRVFAANAQSRELLRRCGFREVGTYERHVRAADGWRDVVVVEVLLGPARRDGESS